MSVLPGPLLYVPHSMCVRLSVAEILVRGQIVDLVCIAMFVSQSTALSEAGLQQKRHVQAQRQRLAHMQVCHCVAIAVFWCASYHWLSGGAHRRML